MFGIVKASPDNFSGAQLELYVERRHLRSEIDRHDVTLGTPRRLQLNDLYLLAVFKPCGYQLPCRRIRKVGVEQPIRIAYPARAPIRGTVSTEFRDARSAPSCKHNQLMPCFLVDAGL